MTSRKRERPEFKPQDLPGELPILPLRNKRYGCHLIEENGKRMYVTAGIGTSIIPVRFLNPPEIVLITIRPAGRS